MAAPIFRFRNVRKSITSTADTLIYGVITGEDGLAENTLPNEISSVLLTVQCANIDTTGCAVTVSVSDGTTLNALVKNYIVPAANAFDPLSGNLVLTAGDRLIVSAARGGAIQVTVSMLEIANATAV